PAALSRRVHPKTKGQHFILIHGFMHFRARGEDICYNSAHHRSRAIHAPENQRGTGAFGELSRAGPPVIFFPNGESRPIPFN
ncbi:MAG: hypothetical protein NTV46_08550, partial [Verrucomicrobia bacterium]|nr:hypothetical protein [Verrucomicrobiota bacterium]